MLPSWLFTTKILAVDTETTGLSVQSGGRPFAVSFTSYSGEDYYVRFGVDPFTREVLYEETEESREASRNLRSLFKERAARGLPCVFHNAKFDIPMLRAAGILGDSLNRGPSSAPTDVPRYGDRPRAVATSLGGVSGESRQEGSREVILGQTDERGIRAEIPTSGPGPSSANLRKHHTDFGSANGITLDTLVLAHCANSSRPTFALKPLCKQVLNIGMEDQSELQKATVKARNKGRKLGWKLAEDVEADYWMAEPHSLCEKYAVMDTQRTMRLYKSLEDLLTQTDGPYAKYSELVALEHEVMLIAMGMNNKGVRLDPDKIEELKAYYNGRIGTAELEMVEQGFADLNPRSSKQKIEAFYGTLGFDQVKRRRKQKDGSRKATVSVDKKVLESLSSRSPLAKAMLEISEAQHQLNSFIKPFSELGIWVADQMILFPNFNSVGPVTNRFSCSRPNLQNITAESSPFRKSSVEFKTRECFIPRKGHWWALADYSQIEVWLAGYLSQDVVILEILERGDSVHDLTCDKVFGHMPDFKEKRSTYRKLAKILTFSILYGSGPKALAELLNVTYEEAVVYYANFWKTYPGLKAYSKRLEDQVNKDGYVQDPFGRVYFVPKVSAYKALNYIVQGTAAGVMKRALRDVSRLLKASYPEAELLMTIHDEIVLEAPVGLFKAIGDKFIADVSKAMQGETHKILGMPKPFDLEVSMVVENWGKKIKYTP